jgi:hypothetical protein
MSRAQDPGLPAPSGTAVDNPTGRPAMQYTLPKRITQTVMWKQSGFTDDDLTFIMVEPSVHDEEESRKFGRGDQIKINLRLGHRCLYKIGKTVVNLNNDLITRWMEAIGYKGRALWDRKFAEMCLLTEEDDAEMSATGKSLTV